MEDKKGRKLYLVEGSWVPVDSSDLRNGYSTVAFDRVDSDVLVINKAGYKVLRCLYDGGKNGVEEERLLMAMNKEYGFKDKDVLNFLKFLEEHRVISKNGTQPKYQSIHRGD